MGLKISGNIGRDESSGYLVDIELPEPNLSEKLLWSAVLVSKIIKGYSTSQGISDAIHSVEEFRKFFSRK